MASSSFVAGSPPASLTQSLLEGGLPAVPERAGFSTPAGAEPAVGDPNITPRKPPAPPQPGYTPQTQKVVDGLLARSSSPPGSVHSVTTSVAASEFFDPVGTNVIAVGTGHDVQYVAVPAPVPPASPASAPRPASPSCRASFVKGLKDSLIDYGSSYFLTLGLSTAIQVYSGPASPIVMAGVNAMGAYLIDVFVKPLVGMARSTPEIHLSYMMDIQVGQKSAARLVSVPYKHEVKVENPKGKALGVVASAGAGFLDSYVPSAVTGFAGYVLGHAVAKIPKCCGFWKSAPEKRTDSIPDVIATLQADSKQTVDFSVRVIKKSS